MLSIHTLLPSSISVPAASRCCLLPSSLSVLSPTTQQPLGAVAYYPAASRRCLLPNSISVLPPNTQQHLGAVAYYPAASRCCLLPSSISVLPTTQQHLGAAAYYPAASRCCLLIAYPHAAARRCHTRSISIPYICLVLPTPQHPGCANSISVLPTTKQHLGAAAYHQAAPQCCLLITYPQHLGAAHDRHARSITVLPTTSLCLQHLSAAYPTASWCCPLPTCLLLHVGAD